MKRSNFLRNKKYGKQGQLNVYRVINFYKYSSNSMSFWKFLKCGERRNMPVGFYHGELARFNYGSNSRHF